MTASWVRIPPSPPFARLYLAVSTSAVASLFSSTSAPIVAGRVNWGWTRTDPWSSAWSRDIVAHVPGASALVARALHAVATRGYVDGAERRQHVIFFTGSDNP